ncbi:MULTISPECIES: VWA domain-containing protein [Arenibacter]|jgi:Ca-activated chloride channel family protein|uniref:von Willebrand factor type A domain protein n=1 Tax=Arenibacter algicola TaxID=616991 RepID=A0A221UT75_9FLAO|nr:MULTISPECIES: VWA domain-containing protein [Arenibacter]ASO04522.1 von Willebrand factor type A domain protein [Arenibacter algicola]MDX1758185.1 VWA domain-containing protein [Arenibacter algicola]GBF18107.1 von Willebrand factor type A domain protein [Arenibacter sp. NBRC 103722]|tara:strand:- start:64129 stop:65166 length:1038 start_codon:yes stop_codon:yes gene_type:complete
MIQLDEKSYLYLLSIIPVMVVLFVLLQIWKKRTQRKFADLSLLKRLTPDRSNFKSTLKLIFVLLGIASLTMALVNPKIGTKLETVKREGVDIVFAVDVSKSMLAEDIAPNRLEKAKRLVSEIINQLASDRIGIIAYAGQAFPQLPITTDYGAAKMFLQNMNTDMLSSQGTAIDQAIELASTYYDDEEQTNRVLFIISDGEDHSEGNVSNAVENATNEGIRVFSIGVGKTKGAPIPLKRNGIVESLKKDNQGEVVITKLNEQVLQEIADEGNGEYINGENTEEAVAFIKEQLNQMDKKEFEAKQFAEFKDQFQWFLAAGLLFLFLDIFVLDRKTKWLKKLNLFNER